jgi:3-methyladenine DNA glycosylase/8-oxoguanine DNA glycosylase
VIDATLQPRPPYSLAHSAAGVSDLTRRFRDGILTVVFEAAGAPACALVWQRRDGTLGVRLQGEDAAAALDALRFLLAADVDLRPFLRQAARDPLLASTVHGNEGYRPLRLSTVTHAFLRAMCGQLIQAREARRIESRLIRRIARPVGDLRLAPTRADIGRLSAADAAACGLAGRRAAALVRLNGDLDLERLRAATTSAAVARLVRERTLGPWTAGMVSLYGLGRYEHGLVGDLGLIRVCRALWRREVDGAETAALLEPYGEWAGLASLYLLRHPFAHRRGPAPAVASVAG